MDICYLKYSIARLKFFHIYFYIPIFIHLPCLKNKTFFQNLKSLQTYFISIIIKCISVELKLNTLIKTVYLNFFK